MTASLALLGCVVGDAFFAGHGGAAGDGGAGGDSAESIGPAAGPGSGGGGEAPASRCGDGLMEAPHEQCDDGNRDGLDGCDADCRVECDAWFDSASHHCYVLLSTPSSWHDARKACQALAPGYDLAAVSSDEEHAFVVSQLPRRFEVRIWLGGHDQDREGNFVWANQEPWAFEAWGENEPNDDGEEDCVEVWNVHGDFEWNDVDCALTPSHGALCELTPAGSTG